MRRPLFSYVRHARDLDGNRAGPIFGYKTIAMKYRLLEVVI